MTRNFLQHLYEGRPYSSDINWDFVESFPEIKRLMECQQNPKWHSEGDAWKHTRLAYEKLENEVFLNDFALFYSFNDEELKIIRTAVILHDIGKGTTTSVGKDGNWHSYGHEVEGEKIARVLLWNEDIDKREVICSLIRFHMEPLRIFDSKNWLQKIIEIGCRVPWKYLYCVKMADLLGSVQENGGTMVEDIMKLNFIKDTTKTLGLWAPNADRSQFQKIIKHTVNRNHLPWKVNKEQDTKVAYFMIGLPGAGKNTWIENNLSYVENITVISRDDVRVELGYCLPNEKFVGTEDEEAIVTQRFNGKLKHSISEGQTIVLNDMNLKKKYRETPLFWLKEAGYTIIYVYVEAPTLDFNYQRREGQIKADIIHSLALTLEWPDVTEYDKLIISKQIW